MTQLGEPVAIGMVDSNETECPFDHENPEPPTVKNDLIGVGGTLARRLKAGASTHLYEKFKTTIDPVSDPRDREEHPFKDKARVVQVPIKVPNPVTGKLDTVIHHYPVTCAAHHCIPAQESLKRSKLLVFMVKKGDPEPLKEGKSTIQYSDGRVWADVGYDVNGGENGVWLPGNYAVGGGRGGMRVWTGADDNEDDDENPDEIDGGASPLSDMAIDDGSDSNLLTGEIYDISPNNRKWRYVIQAMAKAPGQFHDRHEDYSDFVVEVLNKIFDNYCLFLDSTLTEPICPKCKERTDKIKEKGIPTPFGLVKRLNALSGTLRGHLQGPRWPPNVYTSKWVKNYLARIIAQGKKGKRPREDEEI